VPASSPRAAPLWIDGLWLIALTIWTALPRTEGLSGGILSDEASLLRADTSAIWTESFTALQPPLWRVVLSLPDTLVGDVMLGRTISFWASLGVLWAMHAAIRRGTGQLLPAAVAGLLWASLQLPGWVSCVARVYPTWSMLALLHVGALMAWARRPGPGPAVALAATAVGMAQLHYLALPFLLIEGLLAAWLLGPRGRTLLCFVPSAVGVLPWLPAIVGGEEQRNQAASGLWGNVRVLLDSTDGAPWSVVLVFSLVWLAQGWRGRPPAERALTISLAGLLGAAVAAGAVHDYVTWDAVLVTPLVVVGGVVALGDAARRLRLPVVVGALLLAAMVGPPKVLRPADIEFPRAAGAPALAELGPGFDGRVAVAPSYVLQVVGVYVLELPPAGRRRDACSHLGDCFEHEGQRYRGVDLPGWTPTARTLLLIEDRRATDLVPRGCEPHPAAREDLALYVCEPLER